MLASVVPHPRSLLPVEATQARTQKPVLPTHGHSQQDVPLLPAYAFSLDPPFALSAHNPTAWDPFPCPGGAQPPPPCAMAAARRSLCVGLLLAESDAVALLSGSSLFLLIQ